MSAFSGTVSHNKPKRHGNAEGKSDRFVFYAQDQFNVVVQHSEEMMRKMIVWDLSLLKTGLMVSYDKNDIVVEEIFKSREEFIEYAKNEQHQVSFVLNATVLCPFSKRGTYSEDVKKKYIPSRWNSALGPGTAVKM